MRVVAVLALVWTGLLTACSESTAPSPGTFEAHLRGALAASLTGESSARDVFTEDAPEGAYTIGMFSGQGDTVVVVNVSCPGNEPVQPGTYPLGEPEGGCTGRYSRILTNPGAFVTLEDVVAATGMVRITASGAGQTNGSFEFDGDLLLESGPAGNVHASGAFSATEL
ncbi:MAG TPA: hypothetical protein VMY76_05985 [Gemmatimonadales bacterium]|nr:hypothetical protein [Gemmatimonadales bacterium]